MVDNKFVTFNKAIHHPKERCHGMSKNGQCPNCKVEGSDYCYLHGANKSLISADKKAVKNYRLQRWKDRVGELASSQGVKSLREEIGILRLMLEEMLNQCETATDLLLFSAKMSDLVMKIERLVTSCDRLENRMGMLLDKTTILNLAETYVQIITVHVTDEEAIEAISKDIEEATLRIGLDEELAEAI